MDPIELSGFAGLGAIGLLTLNILLGLLLSHKYNPVRAWPHRRINTVKLHNFTGWSALVLVSGASGNPPAAQPRGLPPAREHRAKERRLAA